MDSLHSLFNIQKELDQKIIVTHGLENEVFIRQKCMALTVEMAELANETRIFKYWSLKGPSAREVILEEYVDSLHFLLSIGLEIKVDQQQLTAELHMDTKQGEEDLFAAFEDMFAGIQQFSQAQQEHDYKQLFQAFLDLGQVLQFSWPQIKEAYLQKNRINHQRQEQGY